MKCSYNHTYFRFFLVIVNVAIVIYVVLTRDRTDPIGTVSATVTYIFDKILTPLTNII